MMNSKIFLITAGAYEMNSPTGYAIGAAIALIILGYLVYSLIKPEKF
jgi:K+-transporting ATPase KdpF subunit